MESSNQVSFFRNYLKGRIDELIVDSVLSILIDVGVFAPFGVGAARVIGTSW